MRVHRIAVLAVGVFAVVLAGAPGTDPSSTMALLSDEAIVAGAAQAAVLSLDVRVDSPDGHPMSPLVLDDGVGQVEVTVAGELPWELSVQLFPSAGEFSCTGEGGAARGVAVSIPPDAEVQPVVECAPAQMVGAGQGPGSRRLAVTAAQRDGREDVVGLLRIRVAQTPTGFSDLVDVPVRVVADGAGAGEASRSTSDDLGEHAGEEPAGDGGSIAPAVPPASSAPTGAQTPSGPGVAPGDGSPAPPASDEPVAVEPSVGGGTTPPADSDDAGAEPPTGAGPSAPEEPAPDAES